MRTLSAKAALPLLCGLFFALSCATSRSLGLEYTNAKGEVPQLGNLVFRFNQAIHPDSLADNWDSSEYVSFTPRIRGRFRWNGPDELVFSPAEPLAPATTYKAEIRDEVLRHTKFNDIKAGDAIEFHTPDLQLQDTRVSWVIPDEARGLAIPQVQFDFNYPVSADLLKEKLQIQVEGKPANYTVMNTGESREITVRLNNFTPEDRNFEGEILIGKGIRPANGSNATAQEIKSALAISSPYVLTVTTVESEHDGTQGLIHVYTSQQVRTDNLRSFIKLDPSVSYTVEAEEGGFLIRSEKFDVEKSYALTIAPGLRGKAGGSLKEEYTGSAAFGELESDVKFTNRNAVYLSKRGGGNIEVRVTNTPKIKLVISKIYENNLMMATRYGYEPNDRKRGPSNEEDYEYYYPDDLAGDIIYTKEIDTRSLPRSGSGRLLNISQFEDRLPDARGIYHVLIRSTEDYWVNDSRFISFSDIGLMARQGSDKLYVFANSIKTAAPMAGVTVNIYGANNQLVGTGATGADGAATVNIAVKNFAGFKPAMIIAKTADDFTYLPFSTTKVNTSRFEVGGKRINASGLDAFVYPERDIYRPGEKVNFSVLVRDRAWKSPGALPVKMKMLLPNGKELKSFRKNLNEQGATDGSVDISASAITGAYSLEVYSSNDVLLAAKSFMIEEFVPDRIRLSAKFARPYLANGEKADLLVQAENFFGPPAANRNYEVEIQVKQQNFRSKNFPGYDFALANENSFFDKDLRQGKTDASGRATVNFEASELYANKGLLQVNFYTTVFDETGRPVSRKTSVDLYTQPVFYGIKDDGYYYYSLNQPVKFLLASANREGQSVTATARVQVIRHEYRTALTRSGEYFRYESQKVEKIVAEGDVTVGNGTPYTYVPRAPGEYEIRVYRPGANAYVRKSFYSYGTWGADNSSFEVNTEGQIDIELDKEKYRSGETVKALFKTPFSGRMLVTVETDHVLSYQYVDVAKRTATLDLPMSAAHVPNVYITATLIKPHEQSDIPLTVAHGFQNVTVEEPSRRIPVQIVAQQAARSRSRQTVQVKALPGSYVTLAAVDNGVLQVTDFKTPDPYGYYYQKRALQVNSFDMYPLLFPELRARLSSTGGDGDVNLDKRVNPMPAKRIRILSYWSGLKKAGSDGIAEFSYDIPQFNGEVRLMAVAFRDEQFGSAEAKTTVADPIVLSTALPRFMSPGDTVLVPVMLSNTTGKSASAVAKLNVSGPLQVVGNASQPVSLAPNSEGRVAFQVAAPKGIGVGQISVQVGALGEHFLDETEISVRPPSTLQKRSGSGSVVGGSTQQISIPQGDFLNGSFSYELVVSRSSLVQLADQLRYLVQYPYGCTEQTVSAAFPQLYFADFADLLGRRTGDKAVANGNVLEAIRRIKMRQLYNGALTLWDGQGTENWWTTVYAAHFLLEARKAGFDVDNSLLETMLGYLTNRLKNRELITYYYNRDQNRKIAPKEVAYSLYVLSLAGKAQVPAMNYYKANPGLLALDSRYLLSAAYAASGDRRSYAALLPASFAGEESVQQNGGSFYSALRDEAIALNTLVDIDPANSQIPVMRQHVLARLKNDRYLNTQENAFALLALGKLARAEAGADVTAEVRVNGKNIATVKDNWKSTSAELRANEVELVAKGKGRMYYTWVAEGISASGAYTEEDNFVRVGRRFFDRNGRPLTGNAFRQNDLVIVELTLDRLFNNDIENLVLTDLLPAGFEIENPRTKELPGMDWIKNASEPTALDVRDDRIHFFVNATAPRQKYYYAVRAVSLGLFRQGPVSADGLYNGEIHSYHGAQTIRVIQ